MSSQLVHLVTKPIIRVFFLCSFVYGDNNGSTRADLFQQLLSLVIGGPWVLMGDFN